MTRLVEPVAKTAIGVFAFAAIMFLILAASALFGGRLHASDGLPPPVAANVDDAPMPVLPGCDCGPCECEGGCSCLVRLLIAATTAVDSGCANESCSIPGSSRSVTRQRYTLAAPANLFPVQKSFSGHTHTCVNGHTWDHTQDGGTHNCPYCGVYQNEVDTGIRTASYRSADDGGCGSSYSSMSFGVRDSGRTPVLRVRGGPGLFRGFFGRVFRGRSGGCG